MVSVVVICILQMRKLKFKKAVFLFVCFFKLKPQVTWTSLVAQMSVRLPTMWETQVQSLSWKDPLEKEMAPHSSTLAWKIPWTEEPGRLESMGSQRLGYD